MKKSERECLCRYLRHIEISPKTERVKGDGNGITHLRLSLKVEINILEVKKSILRGFVIWGVDLGGYAIAYLLSERKASQYCSTRQSVSWREKIQQTKKSIKRGGTQDLVGVLFS